MNFHDSSEFPALVWDALFTAPKKHTSEQIAKTSGIPRANVVAQLVSLKNAKLIISNDDGTFSPESSLSPILFARAVEMGVPLSVLERTADLSLSKKREAVKLASSGAIDKELKKDRKVLEKKRTELIRGRAATRAAATDLARLIKDTENAFGQSAAMGEIQQAIKLEAQKALEVLITALEKK